MFLIFFWIPYSANSSSITQYCHQNENDYEDPLEDWNRVCFDLNLRLHKVLLVPLALLYQSAFPPFIRQGIENIFSNFYQEPQSIINHILQGNFDYANQSATRWTINSIFGFLGILDVAQEMDITPVPTDFGLTLKSWEEPLGFYFVLPMFGPTSSRDLLGSIMDFVLRPLHPIVSYLGYSQWIYGTFEGINLITERAKYGQILQHLEQNTLDMYAAVRSIYRQKRGNYQTTYKIVQDHP